MESIRRIGELEKEVERLKTHDAGPFNNLAAGVAPTANEDINDGYSVGSLWANLGAGDIYICCDAAAAAAVWKKITP